MNSDETVGEYLARAKLKIKSRAMWHTEFDNADAYHICNGLLKTVLKYRILKKVSQFKSYKVFFDHIEDKWERSYFMEDDCKTTRRPGSFMQSCSVSWIVF